MHPAFRAGSEGRCKRGVLGALPDEDSDDERRLSGGVEVDEVHFEREALAVEGVLAR